MWFLIIGGAFLVPVRFGWGWGSLRLTSPSLGLFLRRCGNAAYNASKAAVKSLTESLAHELRSSTQGNVTAHLFIPGWTHTGLTSSASTSQEKPRGAWTAEETVLYMLDKLREGDFYILVPDNETKREVDQLRIMWGAADVAENRPALSRWHLSYKPLFEEYMREGMAQLDA
ncbi:hypothetical protein NMY22_g5187 [Coprinellus aureogranulatus]|nr:hypothetical protein NMY22_g5187 [Coprinellus aureogranulatus]